MAVHVAAADREFQQAPPHRLIRWLCFLAVVVLLGRLHLLIVEQWHSPVAFRVLSFVPWLGAQVADIRWGLPFEDWALPIAYVYFGLLVYLPVFKPVDRSRSVALMVLAAAGVHAALTGASLAAFGVTVPV
ncbi:MAG: hypothetical protein GVY16_01920 [Planctomycetes bacterium]|jgi:CDP-diglyceride synthetase|nr:hypothetical protein [Phycisphaerae bacterium]NBB94478.1 hypothetical protein [Planctomycetota bacterium]